MVRLIPLERTMNLIDSYFSADSIIKRQVFSIVYQCLVSPFKNLDISNNKDLEECKQCLVKCLVNMTESSLHILVLEKTSFLTDLNVCIHATRILQDYNKNNTVYKDVIQSSINDIYNTKELYYKPMLDEIIQILTFLNWKKGICEMSK